MRKTLLATAALAALIPLTALAGAGPSGSTNSGVGMGTTNSTPAPTMKVSTATFVKNAAMTDMFEIEAGKIAASKTQSSDVRMFASQMVTQHTDTSNRMKAILPMVKPMVKPPMALDAEHQKMIAELNAASTVDFDKIYAGQQVMGHEKAVALFASYGQTGMNADLRKFAMDTLPTIQGHLDMAKKLQTSH